MVTEVLKILEPTLEGLTLRVAGAPLAAAHAWLAAAARGVPAASDAATEALFPRLRRLDLSLDGQGAPSEASASRAAARVVDTLPRCRVLDALRLSLFSIMLPILPPSLQRLSARHLELQFDPSVAGPPLPAKHADALPLPRGLASLALRWPPLQAGDVLTQVALQLPDLEWFSLELE